MKKLRPIRSRNTVLNKLTKEEQNFSSYCPDNFPAIPEEISVKSRPRSFSSNTFADLKFIGYSKFQIYCSNFRRTWSAESRDQLKNSSSSKHTNLDKIAKMQTRRNSHDVFRRRKSREDKLNKRFTSVLAIRQSDYLRKKNIIGIDAYNADSSKIITRSLKLSDRSQNSQETNVTQETCLTNDSIGENKDEIRESSVDGIQKMIQNSRIRKRHNVCQNQKLLLQKEKQERNSKNFEGPTISVKKRLTTSKTVLLNKPRKNWSQNDNDSANNSPNKILQDLRGTTFVFILKNLIIAVFIYILVNRYTGLYREFFEGQNK